MRQYNPSLRTDQLTQYLNSVHGKLRGKGDNKVAVCTDCHGVHALRPASDSRSSVHPLNVSQTCARCHADAEYMKGYPIPTDQFASYSASVHHEALAARGDLSAPTCTTCHGNHGAAPPGVNAVQNVCSTCHVFQAELFESSRHKTAFEAASLPGCVTCHSNHRIAHPADAMLGTKEQSVCTNCHTPGDMGYQAAQSIYRDLQNLEASLRNAGETLNRAESAGMEVGEARLREAQAHNALIKAQVTVHSFDAQRVSKDVQTALRLSEETRQQGNTALRERDYRRKGLGFSLITIAAVVVGLWLLIRQLESREQ